MHRSRPATFRTGVDLVSLSVTVTSGSGGYATDLLQDDFLVLEDGVPQKLAFFGKGDVPVALALLLDSSASMEAMLATAQEAAIGFVRQLRPADVASVIDFDSRVQTLLDFSGDPFLLEDAIRRTKAGGATALYNAMYIALKELSKFRLDASDDATRGVRQWWCCRTAKTRRAWSVSTRCLTWHPGRTLLSIQSDWETPLPVLHVEKTKVSSS